MALVCSDSKCSVWKHLEMFRIEVWTSESKLSAPGSALTHESKITVRGDMKLDDIELSLISV